MIKDDAYNRALAENERIMEYIFENFNCPGAILILTNGELVGKFTYCEN